MGSAIIDEVLALELGTVQIDGFEDAIVGWVPDGDNARLVYDFERCLEVLMRDMSEEDARDHFDFNVLGTLPNMHVGDCRPPLVMYADHA